MRFFAFAALRRRSGFENKPGAAAIRDDARGNVFQRL
jgi:hypothetical protein